ncbi:hypothetical protein NA56DRAFT_690630 [Hyaloscypha hepaticicola]|uniref:Uncharacterized protein n=1 Tax=Hyaloscypha hepaticicola TaxID=2082293 RepID=A0A2J6PZ88_9HELO|nr:hypothetical protein NA56DRAFT_690630 [Hyaloscypha hepaticicola]
MLPRGCQAIEDSVALEIALTNLSPTEPEERLQLFENVRRTRASVMQIFNNAGQDQAQKIQKDAAQFIPAETMPKTPENFFKYNFECDVVQDSKLAMQKLNKDWELPAKFFKKKPVPGLYPK